MLLTDPTKILNNSCSLQVLLSSEGWNCRCKRKNKTARTNKTIRTNKTAHTNKTMRTNKTAHRNKTMRTNKTARTNKTIRTNKTARRNKTICTNKTARRNKNAKWKIICLLFTIVKYIQSLLIFLRYRELITLAVSSVNNLSQRPLPSSQA